MPTRYRPFAEDRPGSVARTLRYPTWHPRILSPRVPALLGRPGIDERNRPVNQHRGAGDITSGLATCRGGPAADNRWPAGYRPIDSPNRRALARAVASLTA
jgi:hypothetical protein